MLFYRLISLPDLLCRHGLRNVFFYIAIAYSKNCESLKTATTRNSITPTSHTLRALPYFKESIKETLMDIKYHCRLRYYKGSKKSLMAIQYWIKITFNQARRIMFSFLM